jgi:hypothetical protein
VIGVNHPAEVAVAAISSSVRTPSSLVRQHLADTRTTFWRMHARRPAVSDGLSVGDVAPKACAAVTMFNSLRRTRAGPGDLVAILPIGGLGHFGIRFAVQMGFRTVAIARGTESAVRADELGAHYPGRRRRPGPHRSDRSGQYLRAPCTIIRAEPSPDIEDILNFAALQSIKPMVEVPPPGKGRRRPSANARQSGSLARSSYHNELKQCLARAARNRRQSTPRHYGN